MVFFSVGWVKRRSTRTTTVFCCLSLTTTPWSVRFGILFPLLRLRFRGLLRPRCRRTLRLRRSCRLLFRFRGALRDRLAQTLLPRDGFDAGDIAPDHAHPRGILKLTGGALKAQIELLLLQLEHLVVELIDRHRPGVGSFHIVPPALLGDALDKAGLDRQLRRGKGQSFLGDLHRDTIYFKHDAAGLNAADPEFRRALALAHTHFDRLF